MSWLVWISIDKCIFSNTNNSRTRDYIESVSGDFTCAGISACPRLQFLRAPIVPRENNRKCTFETRKITLTRKSREPWDICTYVCLSLSIRTREEEYPVEEIFEKFWITYRYGFPDIKYLISFNRSPFRKFEFVFISNFFFFFFSYFLAT